MYFSWTNPNRHEAFIGILTCPNVVTTHYNDEGEIIVEKTQQLFSIGLLIFRIDILWE
jgi:hypothetical protein